MNKEDKGAIQFSFFVQIPLGISSYADQCDKIATYNWIFNEGNAKKVTKLLH